MGTEAGIIYSFDVATVSSVIPAFLKRGDLVCLCACMYVCICGYGQCCDTCFFETWGFGMCVCMCVATVSAVIHAFLKRGDWLCVYVYACMYVWLRSVL
jgi:hypothetical protein